MLCSAIFLPGPLVSKLWLRHKPPHSTAQHSKRSGATATRAHAHPALGNRRDGPPLRSWYVPRSRPRADGTFRRPHPHLIGILLRPASRGMEPCIVGTFLKSFHPLSCCVPRTRLTIQLIHPLELDICTVITSFEPFNWYITQISPPTSWSVPQAPPHRSSHVDSRFLTQLVDPSGPALEVEPDRNATRASPPGSAPVQCVHPVGPTHFRVRVPGSHGCR